ncbi:MULTISPECIES: cation diffusion facilitator family transporter [Brochothrix]|uniref:Cation transporter n=1 Tax=Brochothrix thermosphacta TaxID=2756 RepID=A0A1D2JYQ1_BROTH|nr:MULTISPECIES: cation diffusion facilitator family transporter [Brochothrix]SLM93591.1 Cobalt-zinc-cadmium resistance protein [Brachybacterium faecium]ANZ95092.1 cation transporter [Brochothrix thermosphacta]ANZ96604.1 cation transporter [Brochothrix thermosphacta]ATF26023.1 cation transporter [Brochothrix thermosphacta]ATH85363.1 cation transporter [Brochothrix thermosphacta]
MKSHTNITLLSIISNLTMFILKLIVGFVTGSVAIISEAIHTSMDLFASILTYFSIQIARQPADKKHPYGHGKAENLSGTVETLLIYVAGIWIIIECIDKLRHPAEITLPFLGIGVMLFGALVNGIVGYLVKRSADKLGSVAMKSNALHLTTDVLTSLGVAVSLLLVHYTGMLWLDPVIGMLTALYIMYEATVLLKESFPPLMDSRLSTKEELLITDAIETYQSNYIEYHDFRTRRAGTEIYIDFHLIVAQEMSVGRAHELCDEIEYSIQQHFSQAEILIHIEPESEVLNADFTHS